MSIKYESVVPWGRSFAEYCRMFALTDDDLKRKIVGCGDGPASFNCECNASGGQVVSVDPLYGWTREEIARRIEETGKDVLAQTERNKGKFRWTTIPTVAELGRVRMEAMGKFLESYDDGKSRGVYVEASLPTLPFPDDAFDLALCSHFLFLYPDHLSLDFHAASLREMLRVAQEARVFPLVDLNGERSPHLDGILREFAPLDPTIRRVDYEFQIGGNEMLLLRRKREPGGGH
jgi:hypothetical protein